MAYEGSKTEKFVTWLEKQGWFIWFETHILDFQFYTFSCGICNSILQKKYTRYKNDDLVLVKLFCINKKCANHVDNSNGKYITLKGGNKTKHEPFN